MLGNVQELESLKTHNSYLMQRNEIDESKLSEVEISNRELKVVSSQKNYCTYTYFSDVYTRLFRN